jgi:2-methylcitrate dehydratase PrpD
MLRADITAPERLKDGRMASKQGTNPILVLATEIFSSFTADSTFDTIPVSLVNWLKILLVDYAGVAIAGAKNGESSKPFHEAVLALYASDGSKCKSTVITRGANYMPQYAALLNAAYAHTLDFDDTFMEGILHPGVTVISAALVEAERLNCDGEALLTAVAVGYEVVCRLGIALGAGGFDNGFHNTATAGVFGAIVAIAKLRGVSAATIASAMGIGVSRAAGSMQYLQNGAWNKRLHPGFAAHDAFICVAFAQAGVLAANQPIEGEKGLLHSFTATPNLEHLTEGLGRKWVSEDTAIKPYPACRMAHAAIDVAAVLRKTADGRKVKGMYLTISPSFWDIVGNPAPNKIHPKTIVDAQFSAYYQIALTWLNGSDSGWSIYEHLQDEEVKSLCERITVTADSKFPPMRTRLLIQYADGSEEERTVEAPLGEVSNPMPANMVKSKFMSLAVPVFGEEKALQIEDLISHIDKHKCRDLMSLLA